MEVSYNTSDDDLSSRLGVRRGHTRNALPVKKFRIHFPLGSLVGSRSQFPRAVQVSSAPLKKGHRGHHIPAQLALHLTAVID